MGWSGTSTRAWSSGHLPVKRLEIDGQICTASDWLKPSTANQVCTETLHQITAKKHATLGDKGQCQVSRQPTQQGAIKRQNLLAQDVCLIQCQFGQFNRVDFPWCNSTHLGQRLVKSQHARTAQNQVGSGMPVLTWNKSEALNGMWPVHRRQRH